MCAALAAVLAGAVGMRDAEACGFVYYGPRNEVEVKKVPPKRVAPKPKPQLSPSDRIAEADRQIEQGATASAIEGVNATFPKVRAIASLAEVAEPLQVRAARVLALAYVRGVGSTDDLAWSAKVLEHVANQLRPHDPVAQADWAEALARTGRKDDAFSVLARLAKKDLLGSAPAYATYAKLLAARGDGKAASDAAERCEAMTKTPSICKLPTPAAPSGRV
jgi:hypothetical protein